MAKYMIKEPAYIGSGMSAVYYPASFRDPIAISIPNSIQPSKKWIPLDEAAVEALKRIGVDRKINDGLEVEVQSEDDTPDTMHEAQTRPPKTQSHAPRAADKH